MASRKERLADLTKIIHDGILTVDKEDRSERLECTKIALGIMIVEEMQDMNRHLEDVSGNLEDISIHMRSKGKNEKKT